MNDQNVSSPQDPSHLNKPPVEKGLVSKKTRLLLPVLITLLISAVVFGCCSYYFSKSSSQSSDSTTVKQIEPSLSPADILNEEADIPYFLQSVLPKHTELLSELQNQEIQIVHVNQDKKVWIAESINKDYLNSGGNDQVALPKHVYLVTDNYWVPIIKANLNVECLVNKFEATENNVIVLTNWSCGHSVYIYKLSDGSNTPMTDPKGLIPSDKPWIAGGGQSAKVVPADLDFDLLEIGYSGPNPFATAYVNANNGQILELILFEDFN